MKERSKEVTGKLLLVFFVSFAAFFSVWLYLFMKDPAGSQRAVMHTDGNDWFMDWFNVVYYSIGKKPYIWGLTEERSLPPLTFLLLYPFSFLYDYDVTGWVENETRYLSRYAQFPMVAALAVFIISYLLLYYALYKSSRRGNCLQSDISRAVLFLILFLSGVNIYCLDRGNLQVITAAAVFLYIYLCDDIPDAGPETGQGTALGFRAFIGCCCLAFAAALKIFPAVMGILLLYRRKWREAACAFILGISMYVFPFLWMDIPFTEAVGGFIKTLGEHASSYMMVAEFGFSTPVMISLTGLSHGILQIAAYIAAVLSLCTAWILPGWKKIMLLMLMLVMTSGQQGYYCLMFLFLPMVLFFNEEHSWMDLIYVLMFAMILSPLQRTSYLGATAIPARAVINMVMIALYIWLIAEGIRGVLAVRRARSVG